MRQSMLRGIQSVSVSFTLAVAALCAWGVWAGDTETAEAAALPLQVLAFLAACCLWELGVLGRLHVPGAGWLALCLAGEYGLFLGASGLFHWFGLRPENLLGMTLLFGGLQLAARLFFYRREREEAEELNRWLALREEQ